MAETKEMKVRIQLRNGTYQNLQDSTLNLMKGEIAVVIDSTNINHLRYKIGDGTKAFKDLPWADGILTYSADGNLIIPYGSNTEPTTALGGKILGLKPGDGIVLEPELDASNNRTGFVKVKSSIGSMAVTSLNNLTGAVTIGTITDSGIGISKSGQTIQVTNTGVREVLGGDNTTYGQIKVNTNGTTKKINISNYGIFPNKLTLRDTAVNRDMVISLPTLSAGNEIPIKLAVPKNPETGATIAYTEDITQAIDDARINITAGTGIDVTTSTGGKTYTINNTGILSAKAGDAYIGVSTSAGVLTITNKSTLAQGATLGSVKLNGGTDVVVKDYGIFNDNITLKNTTVNKEAHLYAPAWTPEDTQTGSDCYLPKDGGTLATQTYVNNAIGQIHSFEYIVSTNAATTPKGIVWYNGTTKVTGTLEANSSTEYKIYLVPCKHTAQETQKGYDEYLTVKSGSIYSWELIGNTQDVDLSDYVNTLTGTANSGVITNLTKSGNTLTVTSTSLETLDPTATVGDNSLQFISNISQAKNGKITATKKSINSNLLVTEEFHTAMNAAGTAAVGATDDTIMVIGAKPSTTPGQFNWDTVNLNAYAKKTDILNPANYYWADQKLTTTAKTDTTPTFASTKFKIGQSVVTVAPNANQLADIALTLPQDAGTLISTGTVLILNGGNASGWDVA